MLSSTSLTIKTGEIACVVARVIGPSLRPNKRDHLCRRILHPIKNKARTGQVAQVHARFLGVNLGSPPPLASPTPGAPLLALFEKWLSAVGRACGFCTGQVRGQAHLFPSPKRRSVNLQS